MNIAVVGSREFNDEEFIWNKLEQLFEEHDLIKKDITIISGGAYGVDSIAEEYADNNNIDKIIFPADWGAYGKQAGFIRNYKIVDNSDMIIAFWDGISRGTAHTIEVAKNRDVPIQIISVTT